jgi:enoyl-CoA hydratase/carnithine racemase
MSATPVILREENRIAQLMLDRPPRNEMSIDLLDGLASLIADTLPELDVDGVVVSGRGRHFSSGADVEALKAGLGGEHPQWSLAGLRRTSMALQLLEDLPVPVVAAVSGCCFGSAVELAMACHFRIAASNAVFALPETSFDLMPGCGGTARLGALVGHGRAVELVLSGRALSAQVAKDIGLVDAVVHKSDLMGHAERLIRRLRGEGKS